MLPVVVGVVTVVDTTVDFVGTLGEVVDGFGVVATVVSVTKTYYIASVHLFESQ